jgi:hypothetical protein
VDHGTCIGVSGQELRARLPAAPEATIWPLFWPIHRGYDSIQSKNAEPGLGEIKNVKICVSFHSRKIGIAKE